MIIEVNTTINSPIKQPVPTDKNLNTGAVSMEEACG